MTLTSLDVFCVRDELIVIKFVVRKNSIAEETREIDS